MQIAFRCDGSTELGMGHLHRCLVLANELRTSGAECSFLVSKSDSFALSKIQGLGFPFVELHHASGIHGDIDHTLSALQPNQDWVVTDSYKADERDFRKVKQPGILLGLIDDLGGRSLANVDLLLNQNPGSYKYYEDENARKLLGPRYALLRDEFRFVLRKEVPDQAGVLLLTFGASDPSNVTARILKAVAPMKEWAEIRILIGSGYQFLSELQPAINGDRRMRILHDPSNVARLMVESDVAVTAAGSTCYELACVGVPFITITCADNQRGIAHYLDAEGIAASAGSAQGLDPERLCNVLRGLLPGDVRREATRRGMVLVDGRGAERVAGEILAATEGFTGILPLSSHVPEEVIQHMVSIDREWMACLGSGYSSVAWQEKHFLLDLPSKWEMSFYALEQGQVVGFWIASRSVASTCHTHRVALRPGKVSRGIARRMFQAVQRRCKELNISRMTLELGYSNHRALQFYESLGFRREGAAGIARYLEERGRTARICEGHLQEQDGSEFLVLAMSL